ncbi:hypothetical protein ACFQWB_05450 [Paenibacillus thermoaerophilus]|uniref:Tetratricopeptide repeat-containing protein n=1 Tax=Paenibacillus thermoaerophilus TaxID=1215385 RepID=A0ABW2V3L5_9BACL|nr:hypothetical protein [Paenibacillus thermoaerophilus]TMV08246.1 hypothetical protein FE781_15295 [Paenibacillus thermoaerophilus]
MSQDVLEQQALASSNKAIACSVRQEYESALMHWRSALEPVRHDPVKYPIAYWIQSGIGDMLYRLQDYEGCIRASLEAKDWALANKVPLPIICIGRSYLALGDIDRGISYIQEARRMAGNSVLDALTDEEINRISERMRGG